MNDQNKSFSKQNVFESIVYYIDTKIVCKMQSRIFFLNYKRMWLKGHSNNTWHFLHFSDPPPHVTFSFSKKLFFHTYRLWNIKLLRKKVPFKLSSCSQAWLFSFINIKIRLFLNVHVTFGPPLPSVTYYLNGPWNVCYF